MNGKRLTHDELKQAIVLREAGLTIACISERLNISARTLSRRFKRHKVKAGQIQQEIINNAREEALNALRGNEMLQEEVLLNILDDLALNRIIRQKASEAVEALDTEIIPLQ